MKTTQAVRNIRKFKRRVETPSKGKMVTDDYGNKLSVKKKTDGTFGRRHTLSRGKKRAIALGGDSVSEGLMRHAKMIKHGSNKDTPIRRHAESNARRRNLVQVHTIPTNRNLNKEAYHSNRSRGELKGASNFAAYLHYGKRKPKDFTK